MKILVVDDDGLFRAMTKLVLEQAGYQVTLTSDGDEAIREAQKNEFDLLITDIFMPNKDGMDVIQKLKAARPTIRIIAMSASGAAEFTSFKVARSLGATGSLQKPFSPEQLLATVKEVTLSERNKG